MNSRYRTVTHPGRTCALLLIALAVLLASAVAGAQTPGNLRIGFVDVGRLLSESPQAEAATRQLEEEFAPRQREFRARESAFNDRRAQVLRDIDVMGAEERRNAELDLRKEERELTREREEISEDFNMRRNEVLRSLQNELLREVQTFARSADYDLIISDGVLWVSDGVDVTGQVLGALEASFRQSSGR